jgi:autotransporter translocation and assembly factor TamB
VYTFDGPHAMYMDYAGDGVKARGQITAAAVLVAQASATAYGAAVELHDGSIGLRPPFAFRFQGTVTQVDLRNLPATVPVPHVESLLTFDYDTTGQFSEPFITGRAAFAPSMFLGASINGGTVGAIDTSRQPLQFSGDGGIEGANLHRFGEGMDVAWLEDPRYAGTLTGHFHVDGHPSLGSDRATLALTGGGHLAHADLFHGALENADVSMTIDRGSLRVSYAGGFSHIDPSVPFADERWRASLTGTGTVSATVTDLLTRDLTVDDYHVDGSLALQASTIHGVAIDRGRLAATLDQGRLSIGVLEAAGSTIQGHGTGTIALDSLQESAFDYIIDRADLGRLEAFTGQQAAGVISTTGRLTGPWSSLRLIGDASLAGLDASGLEVGGLDGHYDVTLPSGDAASAQIAANAHATMLTVLGASFQDVSGTIDLRAQQLQFDLHVVEAERREGTIAGAIRLRLNDRAIDVAALTIGLGHALWQLQLATPPVAVQWDDGGVSITPAVLADPNGDERVAIAGNWRRDGTGALRITVNHLFLDTLQAAYDLPTHYGGVVDLDATIRGTRDRPVMAGTISVTSGRVERVSYERLAGRVEYADHVFRIDLRVDQSPGIWMTAAGTVPLALVDRGLPPQAIDVSVTSSGINLGLVEGLTDAVRRVTGTLLIDLRVTGTSHDPVFIGAVSVDAAAFEVAATGVAYRNGKIGLTLTADRVGVEVFHLEDSSGRPIEVRGSLGTRQLRVSDLEINVNARRFAVMRNAFGRLDVDADLRVQGRFDAPRVTGDVTISTGILRVDEILQRTLLQPRSIEETAIAPDETAPALGIWQLLGLDLRVRVPNTLRLTGDNIQVSPGTPIGLGNINLRVGGDLSLYKDPHDRIYLTGSFDTMSGTYAFQGRRFDVDPTSSIVFRGDLDPELYVGVTRTISSVETRVSLIGPLRQPELRLSSVPPLDQSDILSLIVFNTSVNDLNTAQQQQLAVRAGVLAAGFLATPIVSAISNEIGLDILEIEPGSDISGDFGAKLTIGQEIAPGLVARFSRQFGSEPYDEATVEFFLTRIIRLRATFSDAQSLNARSPFRRIERAGIDLLFFFSF